MKRVLLLLLLPCALLPAACTEVAAWQRGTLARPEMALNPLPLENSLSEHIHFSKEASSGGHSASGGGCGCN